MRTTVAILFLLLAPLTAVAQSPPEDVPADVEEAPLDLGHLEVVGQTWTFEQELQVRLVRQALKNKRSDDPEDIDEWICWYEPEGASRIKRMKCARNGDLWANRPLQLAPGGNVLRSNALGASRSGYGTIWVAKFTSRKKKMEETLALLPGSDEFDREFIAMAGQGARPPRDIPTDDEFDAFAAAYLAVERLDGQGAGDEALEAAITAEGLEVARYNRIVELIEIYQSLMNEVAQRIGRMPSMSSG